jgi:hypothetical protein
MTRLDSLEINLSYILEVIHMDMHAVGEAVEEIQEEEQRSNEEEASSHEEDGEHEEAGEEEAEAGSGAADEPEVVIEDDAGLPDLPTEENVHHAGHTLPMMGSM